MKRRPIIVSDYGAVNGGAAQVAILSARGLAERGIDVRFVCATDPSSPLLDHPRIERHCLELGDVWSEPNKLRAARDGIWNARAKARLADLLGRIGGPDALVHYHQWTKSFSPSAIAAGAEAGLPVVITLHDYFLACPTGLYYWMKDQRPCDLRPMSTACILKDCDVRGRAFKAVRVLRQIATGRALAGARNLTLLHVSAFARDVVRDFLPARARHVVLNNPCTLDHAAPAPVARNEAFVFVGRFTAEKGCVQFAAAARAAGVKAIFLGTGDQEAAIRAANPDAEIRGWAPPEEVRRLLDQARALVFPSLWYETAGLVALEAMARGVPVIVSRTTGIAERVEDGRTGLVIEPGRTDQLEAAIRRLQAPAFAASLGAAALAGYWRRPATLDHHAAELCQIYDSL